MDVNYYRLRNHGSRNFIGIQTRCLVLKRPPIKHSDLYSCSLRDYNGETESSNNLGETLITNVENVDTKISS